MSDRTFRLIFDGKKGGLVKGSSPSSAAKKACKKLSAETGKTSFKFELQETTKDSKKKVYGPYKGSFIKDKIKVKMAGGFTITKDKNANNANNGKEIANENNKNEKQFVIQSNRAKTKIPKINNIISNNNMALTIPPESINVSHLQQHTERQFNKKATQKRNAARREKRALFNNNF
jgi:hypothetical protein